MVNERRTSPWLRRKRDSSPHSTKEIIRILWGLVKANGPTPYLKDAFTAMQEGTNPLKATSPLD
uniref:Uncharacterized protein n=1 Tax=Utricularia reniformis TaxID=192314 RepID=A0A1Y0B3U6_9LAMI|nr:hypothetical protein AEK19_MT1828 [Utricularia reniformis]ART31999.1 hypothetical protein AEK19_MT1828 [Utricularia reniformis]